MLVVATSPAALGTEPQDAGFIGRDAELKRLRIAWERALLGERRLAFLGGEPGIGKTRLALEFARNVERSGALVLYGRCDEDPVIPYEPFVQVLQQVAASPLAAPVMIASANGILADLIPALSGAPPMDGPASSDPSMRRLLLFEGVRSLLREASGISPTLLVLEDLHWADPDTVRLLRYLARGSWGTPALLLGTFRDTELLSSDHPLRAAIADLHSDGMVEQIEMRSLDGGQVQAMAERILNRAITVEESRRFHEASGGNPFFVQQLAELMDGDDGSRAVHAMPVAAREVIARRLSKLSVGCHEVLARASVLGTMAELAIVRALWDGDAATLAAGLSEAVASGLLFEEDPNYRFSHALIQQALYEGLPLPDRQLLHLRAASAIERQHPRSIDERTLELANHYQKSGSSAPPEEALPHALAAAEAARAAFALDDAIRWWDWALQLMEALGSDPHTRARLLERMAGVLDIGREQSRATGYLQQALRLHEQTGDAREIATARSRLGRAHANGNLRGTDLATARAYFRAAAQVLTEPSDRFRLAVIHDSWATLGISSFRVEDLRHLDAARELSLDFGWDRLQTMNRVAAGALAFHLGGLDEGLQSMNEAWQGARARGDVVQAGVAAFGVGIMAQRLSDPRPAIEWLRRELDGWPAPAAAAPWGIASRLVSALADAGDLPSMQALARQHMARDEERIEVMVERSAFAYFDGRWDGTVWDEAEESAQAAARRGDRCSRQNLGHWLVRAYRARGDPGRAVAFLEEELSSAIDGGSVAQELVARSELAVLCMEAGAAPEAGAHVSRCRQIFADATDRRGLEGKLFLADALLTSDRDGPDAAVAPFEQAIEVFRRYSTPWLEARALEDWADILTRARHRADANAKRRQAETIYRRIGAGQPWLDRLAHMAANHAHALAPVLPDGLTPREAEILRLVAGGCSSREAGEKLVLSVRTVERHIANAHLKTGTHNRAQLTAYALSHGLAPTSP